MIGGLVASGAGVPRDLARGSALLERACAGGSGDGCALTGLFQAIMLGDAGDPAKGRRVLEELCERAGDYGCWGLGVLYREGRAVPKDLARALDLFRRACDAGHPLACYGASALYRGGSGIAKDADKERELAHRACLRGDAHGCAALGRIAYAVKDDAGARRAFERACAVSTEDGCEGLAGLYFEGRGVEKDAARGVAILERACAVDGTSCLILGERYRGGDGVAANDLKALDYFQRGCDGMNAKSCVAAAALLAGGKGIAADPARAADLRRKGCSVMPTLCPDAGPP